MQPPLGAIAVPDADASAKITPPFLMTSLPCWPTTEWDFETDEAFQQELDWVEEFVRTEVEPLDFAIEHAWNMKDPVRV